MSSSGPDDEFERLSTHSIALDLPLSLHRIFSTQGSLDESDDSARVTRMLVIRSIWKQPDAPFRMDCHRRMISVQHVFATISYEDILTHMCTLGLLHSGATGTTTVCQCPASINLF